MTPDFLFNFIILFQCGILTKKLNMTKFSDLTMAVHFENDQVKLYDLILQELMAITNDSSS
jgi:hypothetical protein